MRNKIFFRFFFIFIFSIFFNIFCEITVETFSDNSLETTKEEPIILPDLKGILLINDENKQINLDEKEIRDIKAYDIKIPGSFYRLKKGLISYLNRPITKESILEIKKQIMMHYLVNRYPVIAVHIPQQDVTNGMVKYVVVEGKLGEVITEGNKYFSSKRLKSYIKLRKGDVIDETVLVQDLHFLNSNPFRHVDLVYTSGEKKGTTDIKLLVNDRRPYRIYTGFENSGLETTKRNRWYAGINLGNVWGIDHQFSYQYTTSFDFETFQSHTAQYIIPMPFFNHILTIFGGYSRVDVPMDKVLFGAKSKGQSGQGSFRYNIPLWSMIYLLQGATFGFDYKTTNNTMEYTETSPIFGGEINLTQLVFGYNFTLEYGFYKTSFDADIFFSPGKWLSHQTDTDYRVFRYLADNRYIYFKGKWSSLFTLPEDFTISYYITGQASSCNLLPSEMLGVGGYNSVRGYEERIINGDHGLISSLEIRSCPINWNKSRKKEGLQFLLFSDYGMIFLHTPYPGERKWDYIFSAGPGFRYVIGPYFAASLDWGLKLHQSSRFGPSHGKVHFNVLLAF